MDVKKLIDALDEVLRLKRVPRSGWLYYGVQPAESVADHSFGVAFLTLVLAELLKRDGAEIDEARALKIALLHEIGEAKIGDLHLESRDYIGEEPIREGEKRAVSDILEKAGLPELAELWLEFEERSTPEGRLVRAADKLELLLQAYIYEKHGYGDLERVFREKRTRKNFEGFEIIKKIMEEIDSRRKK
ncbi:MAG: oxetanocin [Thermoplasmata archaeon]|nr:MAG: oxetanocin [Thermoplasmata archaeon]